MTLQTRLLSFMSEGGTLVVAPSGLGGTFMQCRTMAAFLTGTLFCSFGWALAWAAAVFATTVLAVPSFHHCQSMKLAVNLVWDGLQLLCGVLMVWMSSKRCSCISCWCYCIRNTLVSDVRMIGDVNAPNAC